MNNELMLKGFFYGANEFCKRAGLDANTSTLIQNAMLCSIADQAGISFKDETIAQSFSKSASVSLPEAMTKASDGPGIMDSINAWATKNPGVLPMTLGGLALGGIGGGLAGGWKGALAGAALGGGLGYGAGAGNWGGLNDKLGIPAQNALTGWLGKPKAKPRPLQDTETPDETKKVQEDMKNYYAEPERQRAMGRPD